MKPLHIFILLPYLALGYLTYERFGPPSAVVNTITVTGPSTGSPFLTSVDVRLHKNGTLTWRRPNQLELPATETEPFSYSATTTTTTTDANE